MPEGTFVPPAGWMLCTADLNIVLRSWVDILVDWKIA
jgi:hypothetical protein